MGPAGGLAGPCFFDEQSMTNKQIAEKIEAAGHEVPAGLNRANLEALAAEKGVSLNEEEDKGVLLPQEPTRGIRETSPFITPQMASCSIFAGDPTSVSPEDKDEDK